MRKIDADFRKELEESGLANEKKNTAYFDSIATALREDSNNRLIEGKDISFANAIVKEYKGTLGVNKGIRLMDTENTVNILAQYGIPEEGILSVQDLDKIIKGEINIYIFQHNDMDGDASASILYTICNSRPDSNIKVVKYNYVGKTISDTVEQVIKYKDDKESICFITDLSLKYDNMCAITPYFDKVVWIDHHSTSIDVLNKLLTHYANTEEVIKTQFVYCIDTRASATYLVYSLFKEYLEKIYYNENDIGSRVYSGTLATLVSVYDTKKDKEFPVIYELSLALQQYYQDIGTLDSYNDFWKKLWCYDANEKMLEDIVCVGRTMLEMHRKKMEVLYENDYIYNRSIEHEGKRITIKAINGFGNSTRFCSDPEITVSMLIRYRDQNTVTASLYSDDEIIQSINLGKFLSKYFGGGGHPGAAGFSAPIGGIRYIRGRIYNIQTEYLIKITEYDRMWAETKSTSLSPSDKDIYKLLFVSTQNRKLPNTESIAGLEARFEYKLESVIEVVSNLLFMEIKKLAVKE